MAHQHVFLAQSGVFALSSLKDRRRAAARENDGGSELSGGLVAKIVDLTHPRTGTATKFMMVGDNSILELQAARPQKPRELASFFIDQSVQEDGTVHLASRIDPLFLLLPVLTKHAKRWCPLDQALAEGGCRCLRGLRHLDANKLCDVNDRMGPDDLLIRLNEDLVLAWLTAKAERAAKKLEELANDHDRKRRGRGSEGFGGGFTALAERGSGKGGGGGGGGSCDGGARVEAEYKRQALEAVCEYLDDDWATKLAQKFGTERALMFGGKTSAPPKRKAVWEESAEADRNLELSHGAGGGMKTKEEVAAAAKRVKQQQQAMTHAQRGLAKVNKKGMKSISSFFGKK